MIHIGALLSIFESLMGLLRKVIECFLWPVERYGFLIVYFTFSFVPGGHLENHHLTFCDIVADSMCSTVENNSLTYCSKRKTLFATQGECKARTICGQSTTKAYECEKVIF